MPYKGLGTQDDSDSLIYFDRLLQIIFHHSYRCIYNQSTGKSIMSRKILILKTWQILQSIWFAELPSQRYIFPDLVPMYNASLKTEYIEMNCCRVFSMAPLPEITKIILVFIVRYRIRAAFCYSIQFVLKIVVS